MTYEITGKLDTMTSEGVAFEFIYEGEVEPQEVGFVEMIQMASIAASVDPYSVTAIEWQDKTCKQPNT